MKNWTLLAAAAVLVLVVASAYVVFFSPSGTGGGSSTTSGNSGGPVLVTTDNLTVGYQSGLWTLDLKNAGTQPLLEVTAILSTPVESKLCTGLAFSTLSFYNCPALQGKPVPVGGSIGGYTTGAGPGSAVIGKAYNVTVTSTFQDGTVYVLHIRVVAGSA